MALTGLRAALAADPSYARVRTYASKGFDDRSQDLQVAAPAGLRAALVTEMVDGLATAGGGIVLAVTATGREAEELTGALRAYLPDGAVDEFPSWETLPHERLSPRSDTVGRRLNVMRRLAHPDGSLKVLVAPIRSVVQPLVKGLGELSPVRLATGEERPFDDVIHELAEAAYARVDMVTHRGEFAVRGGILDVFPPTEDHPIRVDFFGDEVETMRWFAVADQRSFSKADKSEGGIADPTVLYAPPCRELLITPSVMSRAARLKTEMPAAADMLEKIAGGIAVEGMESLAPVLVDAMVPFVSQLPADSVAVVMEPERVRTRSHDLSETNAEFLAAAWSTASDGGAAPVALLQTQGLNDALDAGNFSTLADTRSNALDSKVSWWSITSLTQDEDVELDIDSLNVQAREPRGYQGDVAEMMEFIGSRVRDDWRVVVATDGPGPASRLAELFHEAGIPCHRVDSVDDTPTEGLIEITTAVAGRGFVFDSLKLGLLTEADLLGRSSAYSAKSTRKLAARRRHAVDPLQLSEGDFVVHEQHGIARFVELIQRKVGGASG
ncbi:MAG: transcription-repair coupling factor, partial [Micrococcaceae bacterium]|nr:transcription-repair coupling factor [Micrococcaceae bacterium]